MKLFSHFLASAAIVSTGALLSCSSGTNGFSYQNVSVSITPQVPNTTVSFVLSGAGTFANPSVNEFMANVTNAPANNVTWSLLPAQNYQYVSSSQSTSGVVGQTDGTLANATGNVVFYTSPSVPPIYSGQALAQATALGIPQGSVLLTASVPSDPNNPSAVATASLLLAIPVNVAGTAGNSGVAPIVYCGLDPNHPPAEASPATNPAIVYDVVPHGTTFQFQGFCVGALDTGVIYTVNGVVGGSAATGTISTTGLYTAPATVPAGTGNPVTVQATSHLSSTAYAQASVTIQ